MTTDLHTLAQAVIKARDRYGWSSEVDDEINRMRAALAAAPSTSPAAAAEEPWRDLRHWKGAPHPSPSAAEQADDTLRWRLSAIAAECDDPDATKALDKLLEELPRGPGDGPVYAAVSAAAEQAGRWVPVDGAVFTDGSVSLIRRGAEDGYIARHPGAERIYRAAPSASPAAAAAGIDHRLHEWAVTCWREQVEHRPLVNIHRRTLDDVWRQVIRFAGGDPDSVIGPPHDALLAAAPAPAEPVIHGVNCPKAPHTHGGELHDENDDTPYDVDGVRYCGRCHRSL